MDASDVTTAMLHAENMLHCVLILLFTIIKTYEENCFDSECIDLTDVWPDPYIPLRQRFGPNKTRVPLLSV